MKMKKTLMTMVLAAAIGAIGLQQASARVPGGNFHVKHRHFHSLDAATKQKIVKFQKDTQELRKQIVMKRAEEAALTRGEKPDVSTVRKTAGELFDLRMTLQEKAKTAGIFPPFRARSADNKAMEEIKVKKMAGFLAATTDLRRQVFIKRAEKRALMHVQNPNALEVAKVSGELFDLKTSLREKAEAAGIERGFPGFGREKMENGRRSHHRGFGLMGDKDGMQQGPDMGFPPLFAAGESIN